MNRYLKPIVTSFFKSSFIGLLFLFFANDIKAQDYPIGCWLGYSLRKPVGKKLSWNNDLQLRFKNNSAFYDYTLMRTGLQYEVNKNFSFTAGLLYGTDNLNDKTLPVWHNEYRIYQDAKYLIGDIKKVQVAQQFRLEQRWFDMRNISHTKETLFAVRYRYRFDLRKQLSEKWKIGTGNELMYQYSKGKTIYNQDRIWIGAGYNFNPKKELQFNLMQILWRAPDQTVLRFSYLVQL